MNDGFRRQVATVLSEKISQIVRLEKPPTIIAAPPSEVSDYPSVAIWLESFLPHFAQEEELMVDANGQILMGARATLDRDAVAGPARIDYDHTLSKLGTLRSSGRIWAGCRLSPKREAIESKILGLFLQDDVAVGLMYLTIDEPRIGDIVLPWKWTVVASTDKVTWTSEFAFAERLWTWIDFDVDVDILVPRSRPEIRRLLLALETGYDEQIASQGAAEASYDLQINSDGSVTSVTP